MSIAIQGALSRVTTKCRPTSPPAWWLTGQADGHVDQLRADGGEIPSATRRGFQLAETARAYQLKREPVTTVTKLNKAYNESPDITRFSLARPALQTSRA